MKNILIAIIICCACNMSAQSKYRFEITSKTIVTSTTTNINDFDRTVMYFSNDRKWLVGELQKAMLDPKASNLTQCEAAYYLGELRMPDAIESLLEKITLSLDATHLIITHLPSFTKTPAFEALVKIGIPSIPAVIRNLAESDDVKVRELSLKGLCRIEGDKDIVQLRLQKALVAEQDLQKKTRLKAALDTLEKTN